MVVTTSGFSVLARFTGKAGGVENLRIAEYPGPVGVHDAAAIAAHIEKTLMDRIVEGLTSATAAVPAATRSGGAAGEIACGGTLDEVMRHFEAREWSDNLPFVPPTRERVAAFLRYTDRDPDGRVAVLPSANLVATPRVIAVNAVMAGCRPEHLPLLIAAVEALGDERCSLNNIGSSSGIFPYMLIGGPIARTLGIAAGPQLVNRGPNPALGRALGFLVRNVAGFRPGSSYMGTFGYPLAIALAEPEDSPWPPFQVEQGYGPEADTVTIGVTNNWGPSPSPYHTADKDGAQTALELMCREIIGKTRLYHFPDIGPDAEKVMLTILVSPPVAKALADAGYAKADVRRYLHQHATMRLRDYDWVLKYTAIMRTTARDQVAAGVLPPEFAGDPDDVVRVLSSPDLVHLVVCGDPHRNRIMVMEGGHTQPTTKPVKLPAAWDALRARR